METENRTSKATGGYGILFPWSSPLLPKPSFFFEGDDGTKGGGGGGNPADPPKDPAPAADPPGKAVPYDRFKQVNDEKNAYAKQLKELQDKQSKADDDKLAEQKKFQELAENKAKEADDEKKAHDSTKAALKSERISSALRIAALEAGASKEQVPYVLKAVERDEIEVGDDGVVTGADKAIEVLKKAVPEMFSGSSDGKPGPGGKPPKNGAKTVDSIVEEQINRKKNEGQHKDPDAKGYFQRPEFIR